MHNSSLDCRVEYRWALSCQEKNIILVCLFLILHSSLPKSNISVPTKNVQGFVDATAAAARPDKPLQRSGATLSERDYDATSSPPFFHQWKQVITPDPFTSLMAFSALLRRGVMERPLMKIHMEGCLKMSATPPVHFGPVSHQEEAFHTIILKRSAISGIKHRIWTSQKSSLRFPRI